MDCEAYDPDYPFCNFEVIEFPITFVGLASILDLDIGIDLNKSAYLKTTHEGQWMKFDDARKVSAHHSAFTIEQINSHTIQIQFKPTKYSISWAKTSKQFDHTFLFDLRLIKLDGEHCCYTEYHAEIGRYYITGQCEYCDVTHFPEVIDFGVVPLKTKVSRYIDITNRSSKIPAIITFKKKPSLTIEPEQIIVHPGCTKSINVTLKPSSFDISKSLQAEIRNIHDLPPDLKEMVIPYTITINRNIIFDKAPKQVDIQSLHRLYEPNPDYTYIGKEKNIHMKKQAIALDILKSSKFIINKKKKHYKERKDLFLSFEEEKSVRCICQNNMKSKISMHNLFKISVLPLPVDFGEVGVDSYAENEIMIKNDSEFDIFIMLFENSNISFSETQLKAIKLKILAFDEAKIKIYYFGVVEGQHKGLFQFTVDKQFNRTHPYIAHVSIPKLVVKEKVLKFGMTTSEKFILFVPVKLENKYNVNIDFEWHAEDTDIPFKILPGHGSVPKYSCRICDVLYVCKPHTAIAYKIELKSPSIIGTMVIPFELIILSKKLSVGFTQPFTNFKDVPLNIATSLEAMLENPSKEFFYFSVEEPLIPGIFIAPMTGIIRPRTFVNFEITVKISCSLEFNYDICVKINNRENIMLNVTGNVLEPKLVILPKTINLPRIPSNMKTIIPVQVKNLGTLKTVIEVQEKDKKTMCSIVPIDVLMNNEKNNEQQKVTIFFLEKGQAKTIYLQVYGSSLHEYDAYIPFQINGILGPPTHDNRTLAHDYYTKEYEKLYENSAKAKVIPIDKEISYCHITGVITKEWLQFSCENFHFDYVAGGTNVKTFKITNISKYLLNIQIITTKLSPNFTLKLNDNLQIYDPTEIKLQLQPEHEASFSIKFHPKRHGQFVAIAILYLEKCFTVPFYNLKFTGKRQRVPKMTVNVPWIIFPPCAVGEKLFREIKLLFEGPSTTEKFFSSHSENLNVDVKFSKAEIKDNLGKCETVVTVEISITRKNVLEKTLLLRFHHESGAVCDVEISICFTNCPLTTHVSNLVGPKNNPYPYYPTLNQLELYEYMEDCTAFLERWLFIQGFRRDFYPAIPDSLYSLSSNVHTKQKGINLSYLVFIRRIAGPIMKHFCKVPTKALVDESQLVKEIHDIYAEIIKLLMSRGSSMWVVNPKFLLSHRQFKTYTNYVAPKGNIDILLIEELLNDVEKFKRLSKQSWIDFILQTYRVFILESCFFDCVCISGEKRDIIKILLGWYNNQIMAEHLQLRGNTKNVKIIKNLTTDLSDGIALVSALLYNCPFLKDHFAIFREPDGDETEGIIIHNACLIIEALKHLRINFPLKSSELLKPNFVQMLFLSIHLYIVLPMFKPRELLNFHPPLLKTSQRLVSIYPESQELLKYDFVIFNNKNNSFIVEKAPASFDGNITYLSVKYTANFVRTQHSTLLVYGHNKTRIFDTYVIFSLEGGISSLEPYKKCIIAGPLYRSIKVDIVLSSPFKSSSTFNVFIANKEPEIPVDWKHITKPRFLARRLNLTDKEILLTVNKNEQEDPTEHKISLKLVCLNAQTQFGYIWFRSEIGEFFVKVTSQARHEWPVDTLTAKLNEWPPTPCSCQRVCECYRTSVVLVPHKNDLMVKALRLALQENASEVMMSVFDRLIDKTFGRLILAKLFAEGGTNLAKVAHILRNESIYKIKSKTLKPWIEGVTLQQHTGAILSLPITITFRNEVVGKPEKYPERNTIVFTSECGMDIRAYRIHFIESKSWHECFDSK